MRRIFSYSKQVNFWYGTYRLLFHALRGGKEVYCTCDGLNGTMIYTIESLRYHRIDINDEFASLHSIYWDINSFNDINLRGIWSWSHGTWRTLVESHLKFNSSLHELLNYFLRDDILFLCDSIEIVKFYFEFEKTFNRSSNSSGTVFYGLLLETIVIIYSIYLCITIGSDIFIKRFKCPSH